jgi:phosphate transport system substrate-binding protein
MRKLMRALLVLSALAIAALAGPSAASAAAPSVTVTPSTGLVDGQVVLVSWAGFAPSTDVFIDTCKHGATDFGKYCTQPSGDAEDVISDGNGGGLIRYLVTETNYGKFSCSALQKCDIVVMQNPGDLSGAVRVPFSFAPSIQGCPGSTVPPVAGEGSSSAAYMMYRWENAACKLPSHLNVTYTNDNSYDGLTNWVNSNQNSNFAMTGVPLPADQAKQLADSHRQFAYAPTALTSLDVVFNIVDQQGHQLQHLVLTPKIVAEIATGELGTFDCPASVSDSDCINVYGGDPDIRRLNPGVDFPAGPVNFFIRSEHSASNVAFTSWLTATAPSIWTYGVTDVWPPPDPHHCLTCPGGELGENIVLRSVASPYFYGSQNIYIGIVDSTYAAIGNLPAASIANPGQPDTGVAPTAASLASALGDATPGTDGMLQPKWDTSNPNSYPLPMLTYAAVPTSKKWPNFTADDGKMLAAFLRYAIGDGQQNLAPGAYPLPDAEVHQTTAVAAEIPTSEPATPGTGNQSPGGSQGGGSFGGGSFGGGTPTVPVGGGGSGPPVSKSDTSSKGAHPIPLSYTAVGGALSNSSGSGMQSAMVALALIAILIGPTLLLLTRRNGEPLRLPTVSRPSLPRNPFRRGGPPSDE